MLWGGREAAQTTGYLKRGGFPITTTYMCVFGMLKHTAVEAIKISGEKGQSVLKYSLGF